MSLREGMDQRAADLVFTSVDDCRSMLRLMEAEELPIIREALDYCEKHKGHATRRVLLRRRLKQLGADSALRNPQSAIS